MDESSSNRSEYGSQPCSGNDEAPPEVSQEGRHSFVLLSSSYGDAETSAHSASVHSVENRGRHQFVPCSEHKNVAQLLVSTSPNLDAPDSFDSTPHMDPELQYHKEICEILEETGTDLPTVHRPSNSSNQSKYSDNEPVSEVTSGAVPLTKETKLSEVFNGKELEILALCLRAPLVTIRVGKIQRQGRLLCPTSLRGYLNLRMLPCSEMQLLFTGDNGVIERIADIKSIDKSGNIALDILDPDPSGRSFALKERGGGTHFFWQSERSKILGDELLGDLKFLLSHRPTLSQLTGLGDSRLDPFVNFLADTFPATSLGIDGCSSSLSLRSSRSPRNRSVIQLLIDKKAPISIPILSSTIQTSHSDDLPCHHSPATISNCVAVCFNCNEITEPKTGFVDLNTVTSYVSNFQKILLNDLPFSQQLIGLPVLSPSFSSASNFLPSILGGSSSSSNPIPSYSTLSPTYLAPYYCPCPMRASSQQYTTACLSPITSTYIAPYYCPLPLRSSSRQYSSPFLPPIDGSNAMSSPSILSLNPLATPMAETTISLDRVDVSPIPMPVSSLLTIPTPLQGSTLPSFFSDPIVHIPVLDVNSTSQSFLVSMPQAISSGGIPPVLPFINFNSANQSFLQSISSSPVHFPSFLRNSIPKGDRSVDQEVPTVNIFHGLDSEDHRDSSDTQLFHINDQCRAFLTTCPKDIAEDVADSGNRWSLMENTRSSLHDLIPQCSGPLVGIVPTVFSSHSLSLACNLGPESSQANGWVSGSRGLLGGIIEPGMSSPSSITSLGSPLGMNKLATDMFHISKSKDALASLVDAGFLFGSSNEREDNCKDEKSEDS